jgi:N4-gp56 family major capsid protein
MAQGTTGSVALAPEVKAMYDADFYMQGQSVLYWDQFCDLKGPIMNGQRGISQNFPIIESLQPNPVVLDELIDVAPQQMRGSEVIVTLSEYGNCIEVTKFLVATAYADVYKQAAYINGYNLAESYDYIARAVFGQGSRVWFQNKHTARAQFAGTTQTADQLTIRFIELLSLVAARSAKMPLYEDGAVATALHPFVFYDLIQDPTNGGLRTMSQYSHPELLFNGELAYWGGLRMVVTANAKGFWGAGAAPTSAVATTLGAAANPGDTQLTLAVGTNVTAGMWLAIQDAAEPGNTWSDSNELFMVTSVAGAVVTGFALDPGPGDAAGLRFAHSVGTAVTNNNSVFPIPVFGPNSVTKAASDWTGPYGETVVTGPFDRLGRFLTFGWYGIEGYSRTRNAWLFRGEVGSSQS